MGVGRRTVDRDVGSNDPVSTEKAVLNGASPPASGPNGPFELSGPSAFKAAARKATKLAAAQQTQERREASRNAQPRFQTLYNGSSKSTA